MRTLFYRKSTRKVSKMYLNWGEAVELLQNLDVSTKKLFESHLMLFKSYDFETRTLHKFHNRNCIQGSAQKPLEVFSTKTSLMLYTIVKNLSTKNGSTTFFQNRSRLCSRSTSSLASARLRLATDRDVWRESIE